MRKRFKRRVMLSLFVLLIIILLNACTKAPQSHSCKWELCPYKGINKEQWDDKVYQYTGERFTDAYCIDILHLKYPEDEYEQLETKLFNY